MSGFEQKFYNPVKGKNEHSEKISIRTRLRTGLVIIKGFKVTTISTLGLLWKVDNMQGQRDNASRDENSKKESKGNHRNQEHCNRNEDCL